MERLYYRHKHRKSEKSAPQRAAILRGPDTLDVRGLPLPRPARQDIVPRVTQAQSLFFTKLPAEIRVLIYKEAVGGHVIHLRAPHRVLQAYPCQRSKCDGWRCQCYQYHRNRKRSFGYRHKLLSLLMACRQSYHEALPLVYSTNTFCMRMEGFMPPPTQFFLPSILLPESFNALTYLRLEKYIAADTALISLNDIPDWTEVNHAWSFAWKNIVSMKSLQYLRIRIVWWEGEWTSDGLTNERLKWGWLENEAEMVRMVEMQAGNFEPTTFEMNMPFQESASEIKLGDRVYPLRKPPNPEVVCCICLPFRAGDSDTH